VDFAAAGGDARPLVVAARTARYSRDGTRLAFERNGVVFTAGADGSGPERRVSPEGLWTVSPEWSPDGTRLAFVAGGAVCTARTDGSDSRRVTYDNEGVTTFSGPSPISWQATTVPVSADSPFRCANPRADMSVTVRADRTTARVGDVATFRATVRNEGPDIAFQTNFALLLADDSQFIASSTTRECHLEPGGSVAAFVLCSPGLMLPGDTAEVTVSARLLVPGPLRVTAGMGVYGTPEDPNGDNNIARATVVVRGCTITGTTGADVLRGTARADVVCGGDGDDVIRGLGGNDKVWGGPGADVVEGGPGRDRLLGGSGRDELDGGTGNDVVWGGFGRDRLLGGAGDDALRGGETGGRVADTPPYWEEADRVFGGAGADLLDGGVGADDLRAGAGDDVVLARDDRRDSVLCGLGRDRLNADRLDHQGGCERVTRG
jgi:uncharacterized repeat protein (TIGR01451 family)